MTIGKIIRYCGHNQEEISKEVLQTEMAQYLQMDNLSFLIGAGCSSNIVDDQETGISGMTELYRSFFTNNPNFLIAGQQVPKDLFNQNLEKMLEVLEAIDVVNQVQKIDSDISEKMKTVRNFIRNEIGHGIKSEIVKDIYKGFYTKITQRSRKTPISIFTCLLYTSPSPRD